MNNVTCSIVEDLLPLYMDGCCSKDSQQAVVEHMKTCEKCRETYRHLQSDLPTIANETTDMRSEEIARSLSKKNQETQSGRLRCLR
ncbi:MAG: zf-HC2 domain-containing protein [Lachnospiraceae bacterium]